MKTTTMTCTNEATSAEVVSNGLGKRLDTFLRRAMPYGFKGSVLIAKGDNLLLHKGYGFANFEERIPFTPGTIMDIGSLTKQFTASAILTLEQKGLLSVRDPITKYFDGVPADKRAITLHHLLTHTSGLPLKHGSDWEPYERETFVRDLFAQPLGFRPGAEYSYSNPAFTLLSMIIDDLSGQPYQNYLTHTFFEPVGMKCTGWYGDPRWSEEQVAHVYIEGKDGGSPKKWPGPFQPLLGNGGICCPIGELYLWIRSLRHNRFLTPESTTKLLTPFLENTAYGWDVRQTRRGKRIWHNGGTDNGANAELIWFADHDLLMIIFSNEILFGEDVGYMVTWPIQSILFDEACALPPQPPREPAAVPPFQEYTGVFELPGGGGFEVTAQSQYLLLAALGQRAIDLCLFPKREAPERYALYDDISQRLLEELLHDKFNLLREWLSEKERFGILQAFLRRWMRTAEATNGTHRGYQVLGTTPFKEDSDATWMQLDFEKSAPTGFGVVWENGKIYRFTESYYAHPVIIPFLAASSTDFVGHSILFNQTMQIRFDRAKDGTVKGFSIRNGSTPVYAAKRRD
jgi:CubicO group peptidase (beta-lactamase class C family)